MAKRSWAVRSSRARNVGTISFKPFMERRVAIVAEQQRGLTESKTRPGPRFRKMRNVEKNVATTKHKFAHTLTLTPHALTPHPTTRTTCRFV
jgi:hypothetical protein